MNDTGLGSDHFVSSQSSSSTQPDHVDGVLASPQMQHQHPHPHGTHHLHVTQQVQTHHQHHQQHIVNVTPDSHLHELTAAEMGEVAGNIPTVSVVINDEDGLLPLEPLSTSDYTGYGLDEQEDLNELFDSFPF